MKIIKKLLLAGASLLAMTGYAHADPVSIGGFLFTNTFLSASFGLGTLITATQIGLGLAFTAGVSLLSGAFNTPNNATDPGQYKNTFQQSESSEINAIGRCKIGGLQVFGNTTGYYRYRLIAHSATPLVAAEEYTLGERPVTVDASGYVSSPPYAKPDGSWITWQIKPDADGTETAWSPLVSAFPALWTSDHRLRGVSQSLLTYTSPGVTTEKFGKLYQSGAPAPAIVGRWGKVYDPRESGADLNDDTTWVWSMNGILGAAHIMRQYPDLADSEFDWDFLATEATRADALVATLTGTEPRSQISGVWLSESNRGDTMQEVLDSVGAEIVLSDDGLIRIRLLEDAPDTEISLVERHRIDTEWNSGPEAVERPNVCRVKYYSAERGYELAEIDMTGIAWARIEDEITRYGEKPMEVTLPFCPSASQAQRLARRAFLGARADSGVIVTNMTGMAAWGLAYGSVDLPDLNESPTSKLAAPRCDDENGTVEIPYLVWPQELIDNPWNAATMEAAAPAVIPDLAYPAELDTPSAPSGAAVVQYSGGAYEIRMRFSGVTGGTTAEGVFRGYSGGEPDAYSSMTEYEGSGSTWIAYATFSGVGERADLKCRFFNDDDDGSYFSNVLTLNPAAVDNTTPSALDTSGTVDLAIEMETSDLQVTRFLVEESDDEVTWTEVSELDDVRPDVARTVNITPPEPPAHPGSTTVYWRASALTSNGTQGPYSTGDYTVNSIPP